MSKKPAKITANEAKEQLWRRGILSWKLKPHQKDLYDLFHNSDHQIQTWLLARRCLAAGTLIKTPQGLKRIEDVVPGDQVYGYNEDGSISITNVLQVYDNGVKEVVDLTHNGRVLETCTTDHQFLTTNQTNKNYKEKSVKDFNQTTKIVRRFAEIPADVGVHEPHAYVLGALLGNGNATVGKTGIYISAADQAVPVKVAKILNAHSLIKQNGNYTWYIRGEKIGRLKYKDLDCNYYKEWCKNKKAHEKITDLNVVKSWNKESQLNFLAGLIDTDGSVFMTRDNCLVISIEMQSKSTIEAFQYIIHNHFQYKANMFQVDRDHLVNGPVYSLKIKNNFVTKQILTAVNDYLVVKKRKWKKKYEKLNGANTNQDYVGVKVSNPRTARVYDININNSTNLYLTANGLVTHNCGKTYTLCILALEECIKRPNTIVKFLSPTKIQVNSNIRPLMRQLLEDCPEDIRPEFKAKDYVYYFPNGSEIQLAGSESGHIEKLRGGFSHISIIDEAQDVADLENAVRSVLLPTTLTTNGKVLLAGTPPKDFEHGFVKFVEEAEYRGSLVRKTIYDNSMLDEKQINRIAEESGGVNSEHFQREFLCKIVKETKLSVLPEFDEKAKVEIVKSWPKPPHYDPYVSMDIGFKDLTAILFGYYDFRSDKIIIEDEIVLNGEELQLQKLTARIKTIEEKLWFNHYTNEVIKPHLRVSDINYIVTQEIYNYSNGEITFINAKKDDKQAAVNVLRMMITNKKLVIDPKCVNLIRHLENVKWSKSSGKDEFARSVDSGHYDCVDALIYMVRAIDFGRNPYPRGFGMDLRKQDVFYTNPDFNKPPQIDVYRKIFNVKKGK